MTPAFSFPSLRDVRLQGLLGRAISLSQENHLKRFITDETSPPIALFHPECVAQNHEGDWYGEHAGKWLSAAARAAHRSGDAELTSNVRRVADYLLSVQEPDGYLGTYAPARRFMCQRGPAPRTWDGAPTVRTWDIWVHSYLILGLVEAGRLLGEPRYIAAAARIGELCWRTFTDGGIRMTSLGNHFGLSATVLLDPAVELFFATGDRRFIELAELILKEADEAPALELEPQAIAGVDAAAIATGKAYQLLWNMVGVAKLHRATGEQRHRDAVERVWENVRRYHLTLGGGPWGGVGHRSREVFNPPTVFSPQGYVETCSTLSWIQLNRELLLLTGEARYAEEIEKSAYNDLLGAQASDGSNWCYYSFPNGRRVFTTYWRCCKSSGPLALEELSAVAYSVTAQGALAVNVYGESSARLDLGQNGAVQISQQTRYPFDGAIDVKVAPAKSAEFTVRFRIPSWAGGATVSVNGHGEPSPTPGSYAAVTRVWRAEDRVALHFPMRPRWHEQTSQSLQESRAPDGTPVVQEVMRYDFVAVSRGPLAYATGLVDGYRVDETVRLSANTEGALEIVPPPAGLEGPGIQMRTEGREPLIFSPYYEAGERKDETWRITWLRKAPG